MGCKISQAQRHQRNTFRFRVQYQGDFDQNPHIRRAPHHLSARKVLKRQVLPGRCCLQLQSASLQSRKYEGLPDRSLYGNRVLRRNQLRHQALLVMPGPSRPVPYQPLDVMLLDQTRSPSGQSLYYWHQRVPRGLTTHLAIPYLVQRGRRYGMQGSAALLVRKPGQKHPAACRALVRCAGPKSPLALSQNVKTSCQKSRRRLIDQLSARFNSTSHHVRLGKLPLPHLSTLHLKQCCNRFLQRRSVCNLNCFNFIFCINRRRRHIDAGKSVRSVRCARSSKRLLAFTKSC